MRRPPFLLALTLAALAPCWAAGQAIKVPEAIEPYKLVRLSVDGDFASAVWMIDPEDTADYEASPDGRSLVMTGPPGSYTVRVVTLKDNKLGQARAKVTIPGAVPDDPDDPSKPKPKPKPKPDPPSPVVAGTLHVSAVFNLDDMTPALAELREGFAVRDAFRTLDAAYRVYPTSSPELARLNLASVVNSVGVPALVVQDNTGKVVSAEKLPASQDAIVARVKSLRGK